jgi:hypothetical protein
MDLDFCPDKSGLILGEMKVGEIFLWGKGDLISDLRFQISGILVAFQIIVRVKT